MTRLETILLILVAGLAWACATLYLENEKQLEWQRRRALIEFMAERNDHIKDIEDHTQDLHKACDAIQERDATIARLMKALEIEMKKP